MNWSGLTHTTVKGNGHAKEAESLVSGAFEVLGPRPRSEWPTLGALASLAGW